MVKKENDSLNTLWAHSEGMPKIWQHLKNMNDSLTDSLSNMHPRDASASKKAQIIDIWCIFAVNSQKKCRKLRTFAV